MSSFRTLIVALGLLVCVFSATVSFSVAEAWADSDICGYAYLERYAAGFDNQTTLIIQKNPREELGGYRFLGPVPSVASESSASYSWEDDCGPCPWNESKDISESIRKIVIEGEGGDKVSPKSTRGWFAYCDHVSAIDLDGLDTSKTADFAYMFSWCRRLPSVDFSKFDFSKARNLEGMYHQCGSLVSIDFTGLDIPSVTRMSYMFLGCDSLVSVDFTGVDLSSVTSMTDMFFGCDSLVSANLSGLKAEKVRSLAHLFEQCRSLVKVDFSGASFPAAQSMNSMFFDCPSLSSVNFTDARVGPLSDINAIFSNCTSLSSVEFPGMDADGPCTAREAFSGCTSLESVSLPFRSLSSVEGMFQNCASLVEVKFHEDSISLNDVRRIFKGCLSLMELDLSEVSLHEIDFESDDYLSVEKQAFYYCGLRRLTIGIGFENANALAGLFNEHSTWKVEGLDVVCSSPEEMLGYVKRVGAPVTFVACADSTGVFAYEEVGSGTLVIGQGERELGNGEIRLGIVRGDYIPWEPIKSSIKRVRIDSPLKPEAMHEWFSGCTALKVIDGLEKVDTSLVKDMNRLFYYCELLKGIDVSHFDTSNVTDMSAMFGFCKQLKDLDVSRFDTSNVTDMDDMFYECEQLENLDVSHFDTAQVTRMDSMFGWCKKLKSIDVARFDTSKVTDMSYMFENCASLSTLDVSGFDTSSVVRMSGMFHSAALTYLDVSIFSLSDMADIVDVSLMFAYCRNLSSIDLFDFGAPRWLDVSSMFLGCTSLTTLDLSSLRVEKTYNTWEELLAAFENRERDEDLATADRDITKAYLEDMLSECPALTEVKVSSDLIVTPQLPEGIWSPKGGKAAYRHDDIPGGKAATYKRISKEPCLYALLSDGHLSIGSRFPEVPEDGELYYLKESGYKSAEDVPWHSRASEVRFAAVKDGVRPLSTAHWFEGCSALESADLSGLDSSRVTDFSGMFYGCSSLAELDLSGFDTREAASMKRMFHGCQSLEKATLGESFTFYGAAWSRLAGSELPSGAWQEVGLDGGPLDASRAWASDSLPSFSAATYVRVDESEYVRDDGGPGLTVVSVRSDTVGGENSYTVETTYVQDEEEGGIVSENSYVLGESYDPSVPLVVGGSAKAASVDTKKTLTDSSVTRQKLKRISGKVEKVVLGPSVASVAARAFADAKSVTWVRVESSRLTTKSRVQSCLYGSHVKKLTYLRGLDKVKNAFSRYAWKK